MNIWNKISERLKTDPSDYKHSLEPLKVNSHIHTPYSFSSFDSIDSIIKQTKKEGLAVVGINDFNSVDGYDEWAAKCLSNNLFPLFNIEIIGLNREEMANGRRINDPNNPGRIYISGKALSYPVSMSGRSLDRLTNIRDLSNNHVYLMTRKVNAILRSLDIDMEIDFDEMLQDHTKGMVRERHLAGMIRLAIEKRYGDKETQIKFMIWLLGENYHDVDHNNSALVENCIRSKLLKSGGAAFIDEDPEIFIDPESIREIIIDAGGIPTYPFLADFNNGSYTDFEVDREKATSSLIKQGYYSVEFIPDRNEFDRFREYALYLYDQGFVVTFGTEHNSPGIKPLEVSAAGNHPLDEELLRINYEGACIMAAHQYKTWEEGEGYLTKDGMPKRERRDEYITLGNSIIRMVNNKK
ncbi:MAG: PHP domain-containing protein [Bacteroidales bacterium]|nr:PHP domain-containing protein [Bacteroidales bacterium]